MPFFLALDFRPDLTFISFLFLFARIGDLTRLFVEATRANGVSACDLNAHIRFVRSESVTPRRTRDSAMLVEDNRPASV